MDNIVEIRKQFDEVLKYSQDLPEVNTEPLFKKWESQKQFFIEAFGGLIWRSPEPVTFTLDEKAKESKVDEFIEYVYNYNSNLGSFIYRHKKGFFENKVTEDEMLPDTKIPKGMKLTRAFKFFETDPRLLDSFQTRASMILQEDKVTGYLHLSVHPLDYLTVSENASGWRSCHALDGEYRAGNLTYMCDKSTVVCYLASDSEERIPHGPADFKWNNKKWRILLFFSDKMNAVFAGRQYPFMTTGSLEYMKDAITKLIWTKKFKEVFNNRYEDCDIPVRTHGWYNDSFEAIEHSADGYNEWLVDKYIPFDGTLYKRRDLFTDGSNNELYYNDLLSSTVYTKPYYMWLDLYPHEWRDCGNRWHWTIGAAVPCVHCGEAHLFMSESLLCENCEDSYGHCDNEEYYVFCECCNTRMRRDSEEAILLASGEWLCENCADRLANRCEVCGDWRYNDDIKYDKKAGEYRCEYCYSGEVSDFYD